MVRISYRPKFQFFNLLRVDAETERVGLDVTEHGGMAYEVQKVENSGLGRIFDNKKLNEAREMSIRDGVMVIANNGTKNGVKSNGRSTSATVEDGRSASASVEDGKV